MSVEDKGNGIIVKGTCTVSVHRHLVVVDSHDLAEQIAEHFGPGQSQLVIPNVRITVEQLEA